MRGLFHRVLSAASLLVAMSCGGGGGSSGSTPTPPASVLDPSGIWAGSVHSNSANQNYAVNAVILPDGTFRYAAVNLVQAFGTLSVQGNALTGVGTMISLAGAWMQSAPIQVSCTGTSRGSMSGTFSGADTGTISLSYVPSANIPIALSDLASGYMDDGSAVSSGHRTNLIVTSTGVISGTDANGTFTGQLSQPFSNTNAFRVTLSYSDGSAQGPYTYTGLCFWGPDAKRMYFELSDTRSGLSAKGQWMGSLAAAPGISEFRSVSPIITNGTGTSLNWTVSGASSLSIDHGIGNVTGQTSINIAPTTSTTYTMTATNTAGISVTAQTTVAVTDLGLTGDLITARSRHTATLLSNRKVLIVGGYSGSTIFTSAELFDPITGTFSTTGSLNIARSGHTATLLANGKVLIAGGDNNSGAPPSSAELYDPVTGTFSVTGSLGTARSGHMATLLPNGKVLIVGGVASTWPPTFLGTSELYDPSTGTFSVTGNLTAGRVYHTATLMPNGKVLITGGWNGYNCLSSANLYDHATGIMSPTANLGTARRGHQATLQPNGKVLITGGNGSDNTSGTLASTELYDPSAGYFSASGSMISARENCTATLLPNAKVLIAGGRYGNGSSALASIELYNPSTGIFSTTSNMWLRSARSDHTATLLTDGKVLIAGGASSASSELFSPQDPAPGFPSFSFNPSAYSFHLGVAIPAITPNSTGATIWNINPALSSGLNFNTGTGVITGIPTATNSSQAYQISASNGTNSTSAYLWILVIP